MIAARVRDHRLDQLAPDFATPLIREVLALLQRIYCGNIGLQFMHIAEPEEKSWLQQRFEGADKFEQNGFTIADDIKPVIAQVEEALQKHPAAYPELVVTSSEKGEGIPTLRAIIEGLT